MAVNGIEIKVGQVWRDRSGSVGTISKTGNPKYPWDTGSGATVTDEGKQMIGEAENAGDLVELIRDEHGMTIWHGGEQPAETRGKQVKVILRAGTGMLEDAADLRWTADGEDGDIVAYKVLNDKPVAQPASAGDHKPELSDPNVIAAEMLSALGHRWDGQCWVQDAQPAAPDRREYTGGSVSYYSVEVTQPTTEGRAPYIAECNDLIEALQMNYAEANVLKALWRICAARRGLSKRGYTDGVYDAEKINFFGARVLVRQRSISLPPAVTDTSDAL